MIDDVTHTNNHNEGDNSFVVKVHIDEKNEYDKAERWLD